MDSLREVRFRSSPFIELKQLGELTAEQREPFLELENDADFYGLFVPRPPLTMNLQSVARQTAELFRQLETPSRLPAALLDDEESRDDVVDLVLDGILEIESGDAFVSGAEALPVVCGPIADSDPGDAAARLSRDALLHAQDLQTRDPQLLGTALYLYNRIPISPFWKRRFPDRDAVLRYLGADRGALDRDWRPLDPKHSNGWVSWVSTTPAPPWPADAVTFKLYVSPRPERIRDAFDVVARVLAASAAAQFKIGQDAAGLLRPDKLVAYFRTREELGDAAAALGRELSGCEGHGVPFTAGLDDIGLLSWGIDPPANERALRWLGRQSWRAWAVQRLGTALSMAKAARAAAVEPWRFAIERVRRHGVDVATWTPSASLWSLS